MVFQCEKLLADSGDKFEEADKNDINEKIDALKEALKGDNIDDIKAKQEALQNKFYEISEKLYKAAGGAQGFDPNMGGAGFDPNAGAQGDEAPFADVD